MTTATINLDYNQIRNIVMQMPLQEKKRLFEELDDFYATSVSEDLPPYTMAEINARINEAEDDPELMRQRMTLLMVVYIPQMKCTNHWKISFLGYANSLDCTIQQVVGIYIYLCT